MSGPELSREMWNDVRRTVASFPAEVSFVVTGSLVEGLGNVNSDLDLYAIADNRSSGRSTSIGLRPAHYVDCEHMQREALDQLCDRVQAGTWNTLDQLSLREIDRFYRVAIGIPVEVSATVAGTLARFTKADACDVFARYANLRAGEHLAAAVCAFARSSHREAELLLREAWLWHAAHRLAEAGEGYPSLKWTGEKAARRFGRGSVEFDDLLGGYLRPVGTMAARIEQLRSRLPVPAELREAVERRSCRLAEGVRTVGTGDGYLLRSDGSIVPVRGPVAVACRHLEAGSAWPDATAAVAGDIDVALEDLRIALWRDTEYLRVQEFVVPV